MNILSTNNPNYTDIHIHILPGVDDGSKNIDMSMEMLRHAYAEGIRRIIATPHNKPMHRNVGRKKMQELLDLLRMKMEQEDIEIELYPGNELYYREGSVECLERGEAATLADSRYVLLEFVPTDSWEYIRDGVNTMLMAGYRPILAHIERYQEVCRDMERAIRLRRMGCYIQINAASVTGRYGMGIKHTVKKMLRQEIVDFIATDAHNAADRAPDLAKCREYIGRKYGDEYLRRLLIENPSKVIGDEYI